jgi:pimeloyl-ACP methyl ester carboxylesterase
MDTEPMVDVPADDPSWRHAMASDADGLDLHYVHWGQGTPQVLLLHGWPGFWYDWRRVLPRLAEFTSAIALDFRGFGASAKPDWPVQTAYSQEAQARNVLALLDQVGAERIILVGYDIGSRVAQSLARLAPERVRALVLMAPVYPGYGTRPLEPEAQRERWYQHFHQLPQADALIGHDQETVRMYLSHFYRKRPESPSALARRCMALRLAGDVVSCYTGSVLSPAGQVSHESIHRYSAPQRTTEQDGDGPTDCMHDPQDVQV